MTNVTVFINAVFMVMKQWQMSLGVVLFELDYVNIENCS